MKFVAFCNKFVAFCNKFVAFCNRKIVCCLVCLVSIAPTAYAQLTGTSTDPGAASPAPSALAQPLVLSPEAIQHPETLTSDQVTALAADIDTQFTDLTTALSDSKTGIARAFPDLQPRPFLEIRNNQSESSRSNSMLIKDLLSSASPTPKSLTTGNVEALVNTFVETPEIFLARPTNQQIFRALVDARRSGNDLSDAYRQATLKLSGPFLNQTRSFAIANQQGAAAKLFLLTYATALFRSQNFVQNSAGGSNADGSDFAHYEVFPNRFETGYQLLDVKEALTGIDTPKTDNFVFSIVPSQVNSASLITGGTANVYEFTVSALKPQLLIGKPDLSTRQELSFSSNSIISTDQLDKQTKVEALFEYLNTLANKDVSKPVSVDTAALDAKLEYIANQPFTSQKIDVNLGIKDPFGPIPGKKIGSFLTYDAGPNLTLSGQFENRPSQDLRIDASHVKQSTYGAQGEIKWDTIHLFPTRTDPARVSFSDWSVSLDAKGWYFGNDKPASGAHARQFEGHFEAALSIPFGFLNSFTQSDTGPATRFLIKYDAGADEANGYAHVYQWSVNLESTKSF